MRKLHIYIAILLLLPSYKAKSQDFHLSMYDAAPLFLNPAMTGVVDGSWRIHGQYRNQWKSVNFKPYSTSLLSFDMPYKKWGFGGQIGNYRAGIGNYNVLQGLASMAFTTPLDKKRAHVISFGIQGGISQKSVEYPLHTFNNQYSTANGGSFNNGLPSNENFSGQSFVIPELNAGFLYYYAKQQARINPFLGVSAFNLLTPQESFYEDDNLIPMRFYGHTGVRINITETFFLTPKALYMMQNEFTEWTVALDAGLFLKSSEFYLLAGLTYRNLDAMVITIGARKASYIAKLSYDVNMFSLAPASTGRGGFEISFTYMHQKEDKKTVKICPRL